MDEAKQMTAEHMEALASVAQSALDAWDSLGRPGRVRPPGYAEADAIVRLVAEVRRLTAEVEMLRGVGCSELDGGEMRGPCGACLKCARRERDEARAALATARREGAEEMREALIVRFTQRVEYLHPWAEAEDDENGCHTGAWTEALNAVQFTRDMVLPLDAPGGAT